MSVRLFPDEISVQKSGLNRLPSPLWLGITNLLKALTKQKVNEVFTLFSCPPATQGHISSYQASCSGTRIPARAPLAHRPADSLSHTTAFPGVHLADGRSRHFSDSITMWPILTGSYYVYSHTYMRKTERERIGRWYIQRHENICISPIGSFSPENTD